MKEKAAQEQLTSIVGTWCTAGIPGTGIVAKEFRLRTTENVSRAAGGITSSTGAALHGGWRVCVSLSFGVDPGVWTAEEMVGRSNCGTRGDNYQGGERVVRKKHTIDLAATEKEKSMKCCERSENWEALRSYMYMGGFYSLTGMSNACRMCDMIPAEMECVSQFTLHSLRWC